MPCSISLRMGESPGLTAGLASASGSAVSQAPVGFSSTSRGQTIRLKTRAESRRVVFRPAPDGRRVPGRLAHLGRAELGHDLELLDVVGLPEQGEQVVGVLGGRRGGLHLGLGRVAARQHCRHGPLGQPGHRGGVAVPGGLAGQLGEVRVQAGVDLPLGVQQGGQRELVQQDHHHRVLRVDAHAGGVGVDGAARLGQHQLGHRRHEQEHQGEDQRRRGQVAQPQLEAVPVGVQQSAGQPADHADGDQPGPADRGQVLADLEGEHRQQAGDHQQVHQPAGPLAGEAGDLLGQPQAERREDGHGQDAGSGSRSGRPAGTGRNPAPCRGRRASAGRPRTRPARTARRRPRAARGGQRAALPAPWGAG